MQLRLARIFILLPVACLALFMPGKLSAQYSIESSFIGPAGFGVGDCDILLRGTAAQPLSTASTSATYTVESGFWPPVTGSDISLVNSNVNAALDYAAITAGNSVVVTPLSNDLPASGITIQFVEDPAHGSVSYTPGSPNVTYTPDAGFSGLESFQYIAQNASLCSSIGTIVISVERSSGADVSASWFDQQRNNSDGVRGLKRVNCLAITPDGSNVYAAGRNDHSVAVFARNTETGDLFYVERERDKRNGITSMRYPSDAVVSPKGAHVYVSAEVGKSIQIFERNQIDGSLTFLDDIKQGDLSGGLIVKGLNRATALAMSPDGRNVYAAGKNDNAVAVFHRTVTTGSLCYMECFKDGQGGVDGLKCALDVTVSPDGKHVYACGYKDNAVAVFSRDPYDGRLTYVERQKNGQDGVVYMKGPGVVTVSPNGKHVYVGSIGHDAVVVFNRNSSTGELSFLTSYRNGIDGLDGISGIAVSPRGSEVLVTGEADNALVVFKRNQHSGLLNYLETRYDGVGGVDGLKRAKCVLIDPLTENMYCAGQYDDAISQFSVNLKPTAVNDNGGSLGTNSDIDILVLGNDSDPDSDPLTVISKTDGSLGSVSIAGSGNKVTYFSGPSTGNDTFTYTISDGRGGESTATVSVQIVNSKSALSVETDPSSMGASARVSATPNPFVDQVAIALHLDADAHVQLQVIDILGRRMALLHDDACIAGRHQFKWAAVAPNGAPAESGAYFLTARLRYSNGNEETLTLKLLNN